MGQDLDISVSQAVKGTPPALLFEMMRSFAALARTLNLSQAVDELGSTRQTVRRHISHLEEAMGCKLFDVQQRKYSLTEQGTRAVAPAEVLLDQCAVWHSGKFQSVGGLLRFAFEGKSGWIYHQQQLPMSVAWSCKSEILRAAVKAWTLSEGKLESPEMAKVRPYILAYRDLADGWICVEVGEKSFYSNWFGWAQARSSVGRNLNQFPAGEAFASLANSPFRDVRDSHSIRLDQVLTKTQRNADGPMEYIAFDRLLMGVQMPDGSPAIMSVVDRPCELRISDLDKTLLDQVPEDARVDFGN